MSPPRNRLCPNNPNRVIPPSGIDGMEVPVVCISQRQIADGEIRFTAYPADRDRAIGMWVSFLYHFAPWWVWEAITCSGGGAIERLKEQMSAYEAECEA